MTWSITRLLRVAVVQTYASGAVKPSPLPTLNCLPSLFSVHAPTSHFGRFFGNSNRNNNNSSMQCNDEFCVPKTETNTDSSVSVSTGPTSTDTASGAGASSESKDQRRVVNIDIISDNVCPFCFIGKRRLQKALAQVDQSKVDVRVHWKAFQLNPAAPAPGVNKIEMYKKKFGPEMVQRMLPQMVANGKRDGINFSFGGNSGNTLNSHRLVAFADKFGKQDAMNEAVFRAYFENEQDISDDKVLIKLAKDVGLDEKTVSDFLAGSELKKEIKAEVEHAFEMGVSGVPYFVIDNKLAISGAQEAETFVQAFKKLKML